MSGCLCLRSDAVVSPELNAVAPKIATSTSNKTELDGITLTGVSLSFLQRLRAGAVKKRAAAGPPSDTRTACDALGKQLRAPRREGEPLTTGDVCFEIIKPATAARKCAYAELDAAPGESGQATAFVSHAWSYPFDWLISALEEAGLPKKTLFWIDIAVVNQHKHADHGFDWWSSTFRNAVAATSSTARRERSTTPAQKSPRSSTSASSPPAKAPSGRRGAPASCSRSPRSRSS